jgi:hypothetical protein
MFQSIDICTVLAPRVLLEIGPLALSGLCCTFLSIQEQHAHLFRHPSEYAAENRHLAHLISSSWRLQYRYNYHLARGDRKRPGRRAAKDES